MQSGKSKVVSYVGLVILAILFVLLNMISSNLFQGARIDLTENNLYTLSSGTINIVKGIEEPNRGKNLAQWKSHLTKKQNK